MWFERDGDMSIVVLIWFELMLDLFSVRSIVVLCVEVVVIFD